MEELMKRILKALLVTALIVLSITPVFAQDKVAVAVTGELVVNGEGKVNVAILNTTKEKISAGSVEILTIDGAALDAKGVYSIKEGAQKIINFTELAPGGNFEANFSVRTNNTANEGSKAIVVKVVADDSSVETTNIISLKKTATKPDWVISTDANKETDGNIIFVYQITLNNPKQNNIAMSMENVTLELLDIGGEKPVVFDKEISEKSKSFGYMYLTPKEAETNILKIGRIESEKDVKVPIQLVTGPNIEVDKEYVARFKLTWENADGTQKYEQDFEGKIKVTPTGWHLIGLRWVIDFLAKTVGFGSYAIAIIIFSILLKLILLPLTNSQFTNMAKIAKIQPEIKSLNEKYPGQKERIQQETMRIYKENNVNIFSSCLPMLIQLPILFVLYAAINGYAPMSYSSFLWMPSLAYPDHIFNIGGFAFGVVPFLMAASTWFQQRVSTMPGQDQQNVALQVFFPLFIGYISNGFPSAISLYWITFTGISILHQMWFNKQAFGKYILPLPKPAAQTAPAKPVKEGRDAK
jgi:YidC/Oxa1 family membrane protein insertase